jgi:preprotein translocase SecE subunit
MTVAVKNSPETASERSINRLAMGSLAGTLYVLASLGIIFQGIPALWTYAVSSWLPSWQDSFVGMTLVALLMLGATAGLVLLGVRLIGSSPARGTRAGIFFGIIGVLLAVFIGCGIGSLLEQSLGIDNSLLGIALTAVITAGLLAAEAVLFLRPGFDRWLVQVEEQGWFSGAAYKKSQGQRVRRGTILAILILGGCGIYTLLSHKTLESGAPSWGFRLPFLYTTQLERVDSTKRGATIAEVQKVTGASPERAAYLVDRVVVDHLPATLQQYTKKQDADQVADGFADLDDRGEDGKRLNKIRVSQDHQMLVVLPHVRFTLPILLAAGCLWLGFRIVNYPTFADFLIATEAELNKVSWTTRKRLVQDTIVVLTTVFLLTLFLFLVDVLWYQILSNRWVQVIQTGGATQGKTVGPDDW